MLVAKRHSGYVPFTAGRGVKYPARKLTVVTGNKRPDCDSGDSPILGGLFDNMKFGILPKEESPKFW